MPTETQTVRGGSWLVNEWSCRAASERRTPQLERHRRGQGQGSQQQRRQQGAGAGPGHRPPPRPDAAAAGRVKQRRDGVPSKRFAGGVAARALDRLARFSSMKFNPAFTDPDFRPA